MWHLLCVSQMLDNIIWGEADEPGDHIVPFPEEIEKKSLQLTVDHGKREVNEEDANSKAAEKRINATKSNSNEHRFHANDSLSGGRGSRDPQPATSLAAVSETGHNGAAETVLLELGPEDSQSLCEDEELGELFDNNWVNFGSFEDLDQMLSNDDLVVYSIISGADELWSSSGDLIGDVGKSSSLADDSARWGEGASGSAPGHFDINTNCLGDQNSSFITNYGEVDYSTSYAQQSVLACLDQVEHAGGTATPLLRETMAAGPAPMSEYLGTSEKLCDKKWCKSKAKNGHKTSKLKDQRPIYGNQGPSAVQIPKFDCHCAPLTVYSSPIISKKKLPQGSGSLGYQHIPDQYVSGHIYGNSASQYTALPPVRSTDDERQSCVSCPDADVASLNKMRETSSKPLNMTPQEKIEKLRRRQQIRAMLAIQKQQQQWTHQVSPTSYSISNRSALEDNSLHMERSSIPFEENLSIPCSGINSPAKLDDSNPTSAEETGNTLEDMVLQQLHDIIDKLDITIRLCIRDSLFRLAQSAMQRHYASETCSTDRSRACDPDAAREDIHSVDRLARMPVIETETNHIDRVVAHLLFHRPFMLSVKPTETPESSTSTKAPAVQQADLSSSLPLDHLTCAQSQLNPSPRGGLKLASPATELYQEDLIEDFPQTDEIMYQKPEAENKEQEECFGDDGDI